MTSDSDHYKEMGEAMLEKFDKYWEEKNNAMVIATIFDPRYTCLLFLLQWLLFFTHMLVVFTRMLSNSLQCYHL